MANDHADLVKVQFDLDPNDWHGSDTEHMWGELLPSQTKGAAIRIDNSPFHVRGISHNDIVSGRPVSDGLYEFTSVVSRSGHSTYVLLMPELDTEFWTAWKDLVDMGCSYEGGEIELSMGRRKMFSVDVPPQANITAVYALLERGESAGTWLFQESHCGHELPTSGGKE